MEMICKDNYKDGMLTVGARQGPVLQLHPMTVGGSGREEKNRPSPTHGTRARGVVSQQQQQQPPPVLSCPADISIVSATMLVRQTACVAQTFSRRQRRKLDGPLGLGASFTSCRRFRAETVRPPRRRHDMPEFY